MNKYYFIFGLFPVILPILIALMYVSGLHYTHDYMLAFGIPYGIFNININDTLFFGGVAIFIHSYIYIQYILFIIVFCLFVTILIRIFLKKFNLSHQRWLTNKNNNESIPTIEFYLISFSSYIILFIIILFLFAEMIEFSSTYGKETGKKSKNGHDKTFLMMKNHITVNVARISFQRMKDAGSRLPWGEVEKINR